jgi:O-antigen ligase
MGAFDYAHNDYLQVLAELGLAGSLIVAALALGILARALRAVARHPDSDGRYLGLACTGALAAIMIHSATDVNLYIPANAMLLAWIAAISAGLSFSSTPRSAPGADVRQPKYT